MSIRVDVDPANPGQFFACCGLLELADRFWHGTEGEFVDGHFSVRPFSTDSIGTLKELIHAIAQAPMRQIDVEDDFSSPIELGTPFDLRLDWWKDNQAGGDRLKVWAGSMRCVRIARAMQAAFHQPELQTENLLDCSLVVYEPLEPDKKVEPFYFDARRGASAQALDIGFSPDSLQMTTVAFPAVEFLCLIGLERFRPKPSDAPRIFEYFAWEEPLPTSIAALAVCGILSQRNTRHFRFETAFRTDQRKHKAFMPSTQL